MTLLCVFAAIDSADKAMPEDALAEREATRTGMGHPHQAMVSKDPDAEEALAAEEGEAQRTHEINEHGHPHGGDIRQTHEDLVDYQNGSHPLSNGSLPPQSQRSSVSRVRPLCVRLGASLRDIVCWWAI